MNAAPESTVDRKRLFRAGPRRLVALLCLASTLALQGCATWGPVRDAPPTQLPPHLRVTLRSGDRVEVHDARLQGDTLLVGRAEDDAPLAIKTADIRQIETRQRSMAGTSLLTVWLVIPLGVGLLILAGILFGDEPYT